MNLLKSAFSIVALFTLPLLQYAQDPNTNMIKYWYYRNRLDYFVVPGQKQGESQIAGIRNELIENKLIILNIRKTYS